MRYRDDYERLRIERKEQVLHVVLDRPEVSNAFDEVTIAELTEVFRITEHDDESRIVLLRSTGKHFSAGADLNWMKRVGQYSFEENLSDADRLHDMLRAISSCPVPTVARIQGAALGGGTGLACAVDFAVASENAFFGFSEVRLGIAPAVISPFVLRKISAGCAQALFLDGSRFDARRAGQLGLVYRVVPEEDLDRAVEELLADLLRGSPAAQKAIKQMVSRIEGTPMHDARRVTTHATATLRASEEGKEGLSAFLEKRAPSWLPADGD